MKLLGICALSGSGKTLTAGHVTRRHKFVEMAFADSIKRFLVQVYGWSEETLWGDSNLRNIPDPRYPRDHGPFLDGRCMCCGGGQEQCFLTPRFALTSLGTGWGRMCFADTWVVKTIRESKLMMEPGWYYNPQVGVRSDPYNGVPRNVLISDVRYKNEFKAIKNSGGRIVRVKRSGAGLSGPAGEASSETEQLEIPDSCFDYVIYNDAEPGFLFRELDKIVRDTWV